MSFRRTTTLWMLAVLSAAVGAAARAHDPALHGFNLVTFERPFAAPDFSLPDLTGRQTSLAAYRGHYVLLNFWATWCPPCLAEMPSMEVIFERYRERGFVILAVSSDSEGVDVVGDFVAQLGVSFPIVLDSNRRVSDLYGARNLPVSFLLDRDGHVVAAAQGARDWASDAARSTLDEIIEPR